MLRRLGTLVMIVLVFLVILVFSWLNPGTIEVDLAFAKVETVKSLAFSIAFASGWLFGIGCVAFYVARVSNDRRRLRKTLRSAETEVSSLRSMPLQDAD